MNGIFRRIYSVPPSRRKPVEEWTQDEIDQEWVRYCSAVKDAVAHQADDWKCSKEYVRMILLGDALGVDKERLSPFRKKANLKLVH